ncbi:MAG: hypothetical protein AAB911_01935 [Patescibacteria group bacterium]
MESDISTIIDWLIRGSISIIGVVIGYFIAKDKYIFQKVYDQKLILITDLYQQIVRLEFELKEYVHFIGANMIQESINKKIESLNKIKTDFQQFQHKFWEIEIVLDDSTIGQIEEFLKKYIEITSKLSRSNIEQQLCARNEAFDSWDESFKLVSSDLVQIKDELKKEFRKTLRK